MNMIIKKYIKVQNFYYSSQYKLINLLKWWKNNFYFKQKKTLIANFRHIYSLNKENQMCSFDIEPNQPNKLYMNITEKYNKTNEGKYQTIKTTYENIRIKP